MESVELSRIESIQETDAATFFSELYFVKKSRKHLPFRDGVGPPDGSSAQRGLSLETQRDFSALDALSFFLPGDVPRGTDGTHPSNGMPIGQRCALSSMEPSSSLRTLRGGRGGNRRPEARGGDFSSLEGSWMAFPLNTGRASC